MKQLLFLAILGLVIFACGGETPEDKKLAKKTTKAKKKVDGEKVYKQYCVTCHGLSGDMGASGAFDLTTTQLNMEEKIAVIENGRNTMTPFKGLLSEAKIKAVAEYIEKFKK